MISRRTCLQAAGGGLATGAARAVATLSPWLFAAAAGTGCAGSRPPEVFTPLGLRRVAMLEVPEHPASGDGVPFRNFSYATAVVPPPVTPGLLGMAIAGALQNSRNAERQTLANAVALIGFDARRAVESGLRRALGEQRVDDSLVNDSENASAVRGGRPAPLPEGAGAWLDVEVTGAGYFPAKQAGGFSPMVYFSAQLRSRDPKAKILRYLDYSADHRPAEGDPRFFTSPPSLNVATLAEFGERAEALRNGLRDLVDRMCDRAARDLAADFV